jgi:DNA (cytosine-5)-methyltransferase 1
VRDGEGGTGEEGGSGATRMKKPFRTGSVYYNDDDPAACERLRELIKKGMIPEGDIDERSIADVGPDDLKRYTQCHFFAGIGGWAYALRLAGAQDLECWTGSCPCQPFSAAGKKRGTDDERHLWPVWEPLIRECRPPIILGEQVEDAVAHGWLDLVSSGLEAEGYACGAVVMGAHSVGAPHLRQRLYWGGILGDAVREGRQPSSVAKGGGGRHGLAERPGEADLLAHANGLQHGQDARGTRGEVARARGVRDAGARDAAARGRATRGLGHRDDARQLQGEGRHEPQPRAGELAPGEPSEARFWDGAVWIPCSDGKARPAEPGTLPLADGVPRRVELLKGYGNAVVPQVAAEFVKALIS